MGAAHPKPLRLENDKVGMEQLVVYTDLGGVARVDRLWRAIPDIQAEESSPEPAVNHRPISHGFPANQNERGMD